MAVIVNGDGILTGVSSLTTALDDITSGRGTVTGVATVGTLQLGTGVSISSPRSQQAAIFTNNTEFFTVDDAGRDGVGTITPNSDAHPQNVGKINVGFITARSVAGDIDANTLVVAGISTFVGALNATSGTFTGDVDIADKIVHTGDTNTAIRFPAADTITAETSGTERFRIANAASTLTNKFIIDDGSNGHLFLNNTSSENILASGTTGFGAYKNLVINAAQHIFKISNTEKVRIDAQGRLQVGSTNNTATGTKFVVGAGNNMTATALINTQDTDINALTLSNWDGSTTTNRVVVGFDNSGRGSFSMGMSAASADFTFTSSIDGASNERFRITSTGYVNVLDGGITCTDTGAGSGTSNLELQPYGTDGYINCTASGNLYTRMGSGYAIRTKIDSSGNFHVSSGNLVFNTAGKGIDFSAQTNAGGMGSELLDDYEEGSWTPDIQNRTSAAPSTQEGRYRKIGNQVFAYLHLNFGASLATSSGVVNISGLPFTSSSGHSVYGAATSIHMNNSFTVGNAEAFLNALVPPNLNIANVYFNSGSGNVHLPASRFGTGNFLTCLVYFTG